MTLIYVYDFKELSTVDGDGNRFVIFFSGCSHGCEGCHNPEAQNIKAGVPYDIDDLVLKVKDVIDWHEGITLSGGDPLFQTNALKEFLTKIRKDKDLKNINIWMYTGYLYEEIPNGIKNKLNIIVDGKYNKELPAAKYRGSNNQRIMSKYANTNKFIERIYKEDQNGTI